MRTWGTIEWELYGVTPRFLNHFLLWFLLTLMRRLCGREVVEKYMWNMTPFPAGPPLASQYWDALQLVLTGGRSLERLMVKHYRQLEMEMEDYNRRYRKRR